MLTLRPRSVPRRLANHGAVGSVEHGKIRDGKIGEAHDGERF